MAVYVDSLFCIQSRNAQAFRVGARHGHLWCHLFADSREELHAMARKIGMRRAWFQHHHALFPHYDLVPPRREAAIAAGTTVMTHREAMDWYKARLALV